MSSKKNAYLISLGDDGQWQQLKIEDEIVIGRHKGHEVIAECDEDSRTLGTCDQCVSKPHARIFWENNALYIQDLGSLNGTWINGHSLPCWKKVREKSRRPHSNPVEITKALSVFFGPYTGVNITFKKNSIPITQGETVILPSSKTMDYPLDFTSIIKKAKRSMVIPQFYGKMNIMDGEVSIHDVESEEKVPDIELLLQCNQFVMGAIISHGYAEGDDFEACIQTVLEKLQMLENKPLPVKKILREEEIRQHSKNEKLENPRPYKESNERMVKHMKILNRYIGNISSDLVMKNK